MNIIPPAIGSYRDDEGHEPELTGEAMKEFGMAELTHWIINPHPHGKGGLNPKAIAQRALMVAWVLRPEIVGCKSLKELATICNTTPDILSEQASKFSKRFGIKGRSQYSQRTRSRMSAARQRNNAALKGEGNDRV